MKSIRMFLCWAFGLVETLALGWRRGLRAFSNDNPLTVGEHVGGRIARYHDNAPVTTRFLLVKHGSDDNHVATITSEIDIPMGVCTDEPAATDDPVNVTSLLDADKTQRMVAAGAITTGQPVVTNGDGKVKALPGVAGMYWCVGYALSATTADGQLLEVQTCLFPIGVDVIT
jgi:hypothetical protein